MRNFKNRFIFVVAHWFGFCSLPYKGTLTVRGGGSILGTFSIDHSVPSNKTMHRRFTFENTSIASKLSRTISRLVLFIRVVTHDLISLLFRSSGLSPPTHDYGWQGSRT
jgi:hypothetical protein